MQNALLVEFIATAETEAKAPARPPQGHQAMMKLIALAAAAVSIALATTIISHMLIV